MIYMCMYRMVTNQYQAPTFASRAAPKARN